MKGEPYVLIYLSFQFACSALVYMVFVWIQSSKFNPESVHSLSSFLSMEVIILIGVSFELAHLFEFGLLYLFIIVAFLTFRSLDKRVELIAIIFSLLYGLSDEIHQHFVPYRSTSLIDLVKDTIGVFVMWIIIHKYYFNHRHSKIGLMLKKITNHSKKDKSGMLF